VISRIVAVIATELAGRFRLDLDEMWDLEAGDSPSAVGDQLCAGGAFTTSRNPFGAHVALVVWSRGSRRASLWRLEVESTLTRLPKFM